MCEPRTASLLALITHPPPRLGGFKLVPSQYLKLVPSRCAPARALPQEYFKPHRRVFALLTMMGTGDHEIPLGHPVALQSGTLQGKPLRLFAMMYIIGERDTTMATASSQPKRALGWKGSLPLLFQASSADWASAVHSSRNTSFSAWFLPKLRHLSSPAGQHGTSLIGSRRGRPVAPTLSP